MNSTDTEPCFFGPIGYSECDAAARYFSIRALVVALLLLCCPSDIAGFVAVLRLDSVYGVTRGWFWSERCENVLLKEEKIIPAREEGYATPTVVLKVWSIWVGASLPDIFPCSVQRDGFSAPDFCCSFGANLAEVASATDGFFEMRGLDKRLFPAIAKADPRWSPTIISGTHRQNSEAVKLHAYPI